VQLGKGAHPMALRRLILFAVLTGATSAAADDGQLVLGETVFGPCQTCHFVGEPKPARFAPHLNELFGRKPGTLSGYIFSKAMYDFGKDHIWDEATLTVFLRDPSSVIPGSNMKSPGIKDEEQLKALLVYLATFDKEGMAPK
jgi:cytochrome c